MRKQTITVRDNILYAIHLKNSKKSLTDVTFSESQNASLATLQSAMLTTWLSLLFAFGTSLHVQCIFTTTPSDSVIEDFKNYTIYARKLEKQGRACTLATRLFDHSANSNRPRGLSDHDTAARL